MRCIILTLLLFAGSSPASAEVIAFPSYSPASERPLLIRTYSRDPVTISGVLSMPSEKSPYERAGKVPAVILMHGTGGIMRDREPSWTRRPERPGYRRVLCGQFHRPRGQGAELRRIGGPYRHRGACGGRLASAARSTGS